MMTNLLAMISVCLVTNVTEHVPQHQVSDPSPIGPNGEYFAVYRYHWENDEHPTNKIVTTEIKEVTTLSFDWVGEKRSVSTERLLSAKSEAFVLRSGWEGLSETNLDYQSLYGNGFPFGHRFSP